jgi:hypothetical protein
MHSICGRVEWTAVEKYLQVMAMVGLVVEMRLIFTVYGYIRTVSF